MRGHTHQGRGYWTLPIRRWLALALAVTFVVPAIITVTVAWTQFGPTWHAGGEAVQLLRAGAARWNDPAWQAATRAKLEPQGVDFILVENGREVYRSTADPLAGADATHQRLVQRLVVPGSNPRRVVTIYANSSWWSGTGGGFWLLPVVGLASLLLTLGAIGWFLGRTLVTPLAATSGAARQIATGDLDIRLPASRVHEVADLGSAFEAMSAELRASLQHQAAIEEERRLFVSAIAHDLRTPLFSLRGYVEGLEQGLASTPQKKAQYLQVLREKADALERLIADLFAYTRIEYLEQTLRREPFDLNTLLDRAVEGWQREAESKGVSLELNGLQQACVVEGDEHLLGRAVENLLDNALRYTPPGGTVTVRWWTNEGQAMFAVADSGPGIVPRDLPHLFEPMYRADPSRSRQTGGTGLGLAIARRILRAHGGDLSVANRATGGAEFTGSIAILPQESIPRDSAVREVEGELASAVRDSAP